MALLPVWRGGGIQVVKHKSKTPRQLVDNWNIQKHKTTKAHYTQATKSNSTKVDEVLLWPREHWRQSRKDIRHLADKNYPLSTKSTELNMFNFVDNIDSDTVDNIEQASDSRLLTNQRQRRLSTLLLICRWFWRLSTLSPVRTGLKKRNDDVHITQPGSL